MRVASRHEKRCIKLLYGPRRGLFPSFRNAPQKRYEFWRVTCQIRVYRKNIQVNMPNRERGKRPISAGCILHPVQHWIDFMRHFQ